MASMYLLVSEFDANGRPLEPAFYTGCPAYHNLIYQIYEKREQLESQQTETDVEVLEGDGSSSDKVWLKKESLANVIAEEISTEQVWL